MIPIGKTNPASGEQTADASSFLIPAAVGFLVGVVVVYDPTASRWLVSALDWWTPQAKALTLFSYLVLTTALISAALVAVIIGVARRNIISLGENTFEKLCLLGLLVSSQTLALTRFGFLDGYDIVVGMVFGLVLITALSGSRSLVLTPLDLLNLLLLNAFLLGIAANGMDPFYVGRILLVVKLIMITLILVNLLRNVSLLRFFVHGLIIVSTISAAIAIAQEVAYAVTGKAYVGILGEEGLRYMFEQSPVGNLLRVPALLANYKTLIFVLIVSTAISLNLLLFASYNKRQRWLLSGALVLMLCASALTYSKDGWIALGVVVLVSIVVKRKEYAIYILLGVVLLGLLIQVTGSTDNFASFFEKELTWGETRLRVELDREGLVGFVREPTLFGGGPGNVYTSNVLGWPAHNNWILVVDEIGSYGLVVYVLFFIVSLYNLVRYPAKGLGEWMNAVRVGMTIALIGLLVVFQTHAGYLDPIVWVLMSAAQAFALIGRSRADPQAVTRI